MEVIDRILTYLKSTPENDILMMKYNFNNVYMAIQMHIRPRVLIKNSQPAIAHLYMKIYSHRRAKK
jgi:hypothetical protein